MKKHRKLLTLGVVICLVAGLVAGIVYYKQVEEERKLSLIYIPKVVDGTNDFWTSLIQGAEMAAKEYNADIRVWAPEEDNDSYREAVYGNDITEPAVCLTGCRPAY